MADSSIQRFIKQFVARPASAPQTQMREAAAPLGGTRAEAMQRLQIGLLGLVSMVLLVGLANIIMARVEQSEEARVPGAPATVAAQEPVGKSDPLADAGVAPEVLAEPTPQATPVPETTRVEQRAPVTGALPRPATEGENADRTGAVPFSAPASPR
jgi:hypothetical protein